MAREDTNTVGSASAWFFGENGLEHWDCVDGNAPRPGTILVPSEHVLLKAVSFPPGSRKQRAAAAGFALEEDLAAPLDETHVCFGPEIAPGTHLLAAVDLKVMQNWLDALNASGAAFSHLLPDALALPAPGTEAWTVRVIGNRVVVRTPEAGFATTTSLLPFLWRAAAKPRIVSAGGALPSEMTGSARPVELGNTLDRNTLRFDLLQGSFAPDRNGLLAVAVQIAIVLIVGALLRTGMLAAEAHRLSEVVELRRAAAIELLTDFTPTMAASPDPASALQRLLPQDRVSHGPGLLQLLAESSAVLQKHSTGLSISKMTFSARDGTLSLSLSASDLSALRKIEAALATAGLNPSSGSASAVNGGAEAIIVLRSGGTS